MMPPPDAEPVTVGPPGHRYRWHDHWAALPDSPSSRENGRTHGVVALADGRLLVFRQATPGVLLFHPDGSLSESWGDKFLGAHGVSVTRRGGEERLWLVDEKSCEVSLVSLTGEVLQRLEPPAGTQRPGGRYTPTWAEQHPETGEVWVADGYGGSVIFRFAEDGAYLGRLTGEEGAGRFDCPHGLAVGPNGHFHVADRGNQRLAVYDAAGGFVRALDGVCHSPCSLDFHEGLTLVPELLTGVKLLEGDGRIVADLGSVAEFVPEETRPEGWPNHRPAAEVPAGLFNSPHDACFTPRGDIYVVEWILGGRVTRLEKL